jgi:hypothetical protein
MLTEDDVENPVLGVLNAPVPANGLDRDGRIVVAAGEEVGLWSVPRVLDLPAGSLSDRMIWQPHVNHGRKHETGYAVLARGA